jgi:hypothetical protein
MVDDVDVLHVKRIIFSGLLSFRYYRSEMRWSVEDSLRKIQLPSDVA